MGTHDHVFSPIRIKDVEFKNRIQAAPQVPLLATPEGWVTPELIAYYRAYAQGGFGCVTVGDSPIDTDFARGHDASINLGADEGVIGLTELAETISCCGAQVSIEINHAGRNAKPRLLGGRHPIAPSPIPNALEQAFAAREGREPFEVWEINEDQIAEIIEHFADAARRCQIAGFRMVMIHGAHGHLLSQFLSPYSNKRTDRWGGNLENRARFPVAVLDAVRKKCGPGLVIDYRISLDEKVPGAMGAEESLEFLRMIEDRIDVVHVSAGILPNVETIEHMIQPLYTPHMPNVPLAELVKKHIDIPVTAVGSIMNLDNAETIIANGWADFVAFGRAALAEPEMPRKTATGRKGEVRPCIRCNCCVDRSATLMRTRCAINPMAGRGPGINEHDGLAPSPRGRKKVMVVGGGPAGMQAAQTAVRRGHETVLYEMEGRLGGMMRTGAQLPFKKDLKVYVDWMTSRTERCGARIILNTEVTAETVKAEMPDALIIAVGGTPIFPAVPRIASSKVVWSGDVDTGKVQVGRRVIVVGAGLTGLETAYNLTMQGKSVTVIDMLPAGRPLGMASQSVYLFQKVREYDIRIITETEMQEVTEKGMRASSGGVQVEYAADTIVLAVGLRPRKEKVAELRRLIPETEVYVVGDCLRPRDIFWANHEGFDAAYEL